MNELEWNEHNAMQRELERTRISRAAWRFAALFNLGLIALNALRVYYKWWS